MSATVIPFRRAENVETPGPLRAPLRPSYFASATGAAWRWWRRARLTVEALGWIIVAASAAALWW
jgi:hypothetical protein